MDITLLKKQDIDMVAGCFLFENADQGIVISAIADHMCKLRTFGKGMAVLDLFDYRSSLGLVLSGSLEVTKQEGRKYIMRTFESGGVFGSANLFCDEPDLVTKLTAVSNCRIIFFPQSLLIKMMQESYTIAENYIRFLSGRIRFLNEKIQGLITISAESALARYLTMNAVQRDGKMLVKPGSSMTALADELNIGRASLYRAFDDLEKAGFIKKTGKQIEITNLDGLSNV